MAVSDSVYLEALKTTRRQVAQRLVEVTAQKKPTYSVDGESYSWGEYVSMLTDQLEKLDLSIQRAQAPFWRTMRGSV